MKKGAAGRAGNRRVIGCEPLNEKKLRGWKLPVTPQRPQIAKVAKFAKNSKKYQGKMTWAQLRSRA